MKSIHLCNNFFFRNMSYILYRFKRIPLFRDLKIRNKLIVSFLIVSVIPLMIAGIVQYIYFVNTLPAQAGENIISTFEQTDNNITYKMDMMQHYLNYNQINSELINNLRSGSNTQEEIIMKIHRLRAILSSSSAASFNILIYNSVYVDWKTDDSVLFNDYMVKLMHTPQELEWYRNFVGTNKTIQWRTAHKLDLLQNDNDYISCLSTIRDYDSKPIGILEAHIDVQMLTDILNNIKMENSSSIVLLDTEGNAITRKKNDPQTPEITGDIYKKIHREISNAAHQHMFRMNVNSQDCLIIYKVNRKTHWILTAIVPMQDIMQSSHVLGNITLFIILCCIIIAVILVIPLSYSISSPIRKLISTIKTVENENFDINIEHNAADEIGQLYTSFNDMVRKIKELIEKVYKADIAKKNAELNALQAQINPHFLYNTLDTINWLAVVHQNDDIATMARSLANLFRYSLSKGNNIIPVSDEIELVKNYLEIQKYRLDDRLNVEYRFDPEVFSCKTIKLILQPFVENSIIHGLKQINSKLDIFISAEIIDDQLLFTVIDNGCGIDLAVIHEILYSKEKKENRGYGIRNVNERINLYCGEGYGIKFSNVAPHGTKVEILTCPIYDTIQRGDDRV